MDISVVFEYQVVVTFDSVLGLYNMASNYTIDISNFYTNSITS